MSNEENVNDDLDEGQEEQGQTVALPMLDVLIVRDPMVQIPHECYAHELPILQLREGEENVVLKGEREVVVTNFTVASEYDRLARKYAQQPEPFLAVYGQNPGRLAKELDMDYVPQLGARRVRKLPMARVIHHDIGTDNDAGASRSEVLRGAAADAVLADEKASAKPAKPAGGKKPGKAGK